MARYQSVEYFDNWGFELNIWLHRFEVFSLTVFFYDRIIVLSGFADDVCDFVLDMCIGQLKPGVRFP